MNMEGQSVCVKMITDRKIYQEREERRVQKEGSYRRETKVAQNDGEDNEVNALSMLLMQNSKCPVYVVYAKFQQMVKCKIPNALSMLLMQIPTDGKDNRVDALSMLLV